MEGRKVISSSSSNLMLAAQRGLAGWIFRPPSEVRLPFKTLPNRGHPGKAENY